MITVVFAHSWADTIAQAERDHGETGRRMALCLRASQAGSKRLQAAYIEEAGFDVNEVLARAGQPWSSLGLAETASWLYRWLAEEQPEPAR